MILQLFYARAYMYNDFTFQSNYFLSVTQKVYNHNLYARKIHKNTYFPALSFMQVFCIMLYISTIVKLASMNYNLFMISYEPFYKTLTKKNISTYRLITDYNVSRSLLDRLKHNKPITTVTIDDLCSILQCKVEDIVIYIPDNK